MKPILAIVGRPNVGKSTLFNRIVGGRRAITFDTPGVTRDRRYGKSSWEGRDFIAVDTGGLLLDASGGLEERVMDQVEVAIREASAILFVLDGRQGLIPEEEEIVRILRRKEKKLFLVINKIDSPKEEGRLADFFSLGEDLHPVSAEHGYRVNDLLDRIVELLPPSLEETREGEIIRVALIGRPNVGKSSLLNRLLGEERVVVHEEPGTTRDAVDTPVEIDGKRYLMIDTAGIRRRGKWVSRLERFSVLSSLKSIERADVCLILLDAFEGLHNQDRHVAGYAAEAGKGILLVWNKCDLLEEKKVDALEEAVRDGFRFLSYAPIHLVSAKTGQGCSGLWPEIDRLYRAYSRRIKTSDVNEVFQSLVDSHNPPVYKGKPVRFYYATQTKIHPPTFVIFVNEPDGVHFSFQRYLTNGFRRMFGFEGVPLKILFRKKR